MTADEPVAGVPRLCARRADCTRPRGHDDECGPDRADTELADLRAEVERLRAGLYPLGQHTIEWADGLAKDIGASPDSLFVDWINQRKRAEKAEAERDDALARLAELEGVARTNAAWVQQQHAAAKEAREQRDEAIAEGERLREVAEMLVAQVADRLAERDALQRQVEAVVSVCSNTDGDLLDGESEIPVGEVLRMLVENGATISALAAVEPADQPHPTPEADEHCNSSGGHGSPVGHECRCSRKPGHALDPMPAHGCPCGALWSCPDCAEADPAVGCAGCGSAPNDEAGS